MSHADCEIDVLAGIDSGLGTILLLDISRIEQQGLLKNLRRGPFTKPPVCHSYSILMFGRMHVVKFSIFPRLECPAISYFAQ